jgi:hypothetical protein
LNKDQGNSLQTVSNSTGGYTFSPVRIGRYVLTVTAKGFSKTTQENLTVTIAQNLLVNVQLKIGAATENVEVSTAPPQMQTEDASVGQVIGTEEVNDLPLNGRNFTFLAQLGAGMQTPQADTRGNAASGAFSANGLRPAQNNYLLDGIDNNSNAVDFLNGTNFVILPPLDAIQEFKVQTADFSAELGRSAGAVMNASIKSGTNSLHGAAWEFFRNDKLDAADWFEDNGGIPKGELRQNQFGVSGGGPIIKNKLFYFGDYEGLRRVQGTASSGNVPTSLEQSSGFTNLSDILTQSAGTARQDVLGRSIPPGTILDPATTRYVAAGAVDPVSGLTNNTTNAGYVRDPFGTCGPGTTTFSTSCGLNQIPSGRVDPNGIKLLGLYPRSNTRTHLMCVATSTPARRIKSSCASATPMIRNTFRASSVASPTAAPLTRASRRQSPFRVWRASPTCSIPTPSTRCALDSLTCIPRGLAPKAIPQEFRPSMGSLEFPPVLRTAAFHNSKSEIWQISEAMTTCLPTKSARPSRSRTTLPRSSASTASRVA